MAKCPFRILWVRESNKASPDSRGKWRQTHLDKHSSMFGQEWKESLVAYYIELIPLDKFGIDRGLRGDVGSESGYGRRGCTGISPQQLYAK